MNIDAFHIRIDKHIRVAAAYLEYRHIKFIIKACRLKPTAFIFDKDVKIDLRRNWIDEFGNSLRIEKGQKIHILYGDTSLYNKKIACTDLYYGLSLDKIKKISKLVYIVSGKDDDLFQDCCLLTFLGIDNYLRSYLYYDYEWQQISPLYLGTNHLENISVNLKIQNYTTIKENSPIPIINEEIFISALPVNKNLRKIIDKKYEFLKELI